ncbi:MAG: sel1 repeat family protein [Epsilonproteobacteria bacterium]|nr:sel1 repeat family protein [Campylobacterota bacterium]
MTEKKRSSKYEKACVLFEAKNYTSAYTLFLNLAEEGDCNAQNVIGNMLVLGLGIKEDKTQGYSWYQKSAKQNHPEASYIYGTYCIENKSESEGLRYIKQATDLNYPPALYYVAILHDQGLYGYKQNRTEAFMLYKKAFVLGEKRAFRALINLYKEENGKFKMLLYMIKNFFWMNKALKMLHKE